jgi:nucleoside-diphosphate-sugar epimerase
MTTAVISGASGFVGRRLTRELEAHDFSVTALKRGELLNTDADVFYHLAWESASGTGRGNAALQAGNVELTLRLLAEAHHAGCKKFAALGTIYEKLPLPETPGASDFYILSKRYAHEMADRLAQKLGMDFVWCTVCHPVGCGIKPEQMMAYAVSGLLKGEPPQFGTAETWYDIVAVEDLAQGLRLAGQCELRDREYFLGSGKPRILKDYLSALPQILGVNTTIEIGARPDDGLRFKPEYFDITPITRETGYAPRVDFEAAIQNMASSFMLQN